MTVIIPRVTDRCNSTNGFTPNKAYPVIRGGGEGGYVVRVENGGERFICADGGGGAHLQFRNDRSGYEFACSTEGHFEIREDPE